MRTLFIFAIFALSIRGLHAETETFFFKGDDGLIQKIDLDLSFTKDEDLDLTPSKVLSSYTLDSKGTRSETIKKRVPTEAEKIADAAVMILTSLIVLSTHDSYDLSDDLRMSRVMGLILFVFPFESKDIYRKCEGNEYLVAVTDEPKDETLKQLKSLDEVRRLCGVNEKSSSQPQS